MTSSAPPQREIVVIELQLTISEERISLRIPVPKGPATAEDMLPILRALTKLATDMATEKVADQGKSVSCRAGCAMCCRQIVPIPKFEAQRLARLVDSMPEPRRTTIRSRFHDATQRLRDAGLYDALTSSHNESETPVLELSSQYLRLMIACPFLEDESCSIYDERPITCREYQVTSPPALCANPSENDLEPLPLAIKPSTASMMLEIDQPQEGGSKTSWIALTRALDWAESSPPTEPAASGLELLEKLMKALTGQSASADQQPGTDAS